MPRKRAIAGEVVNYKTPEWQPLIDLLMADWMWMFEVETRTGRRLHAYKHSETRNYLHLDAKEGRAYVYTNDDRYLQVDPFWLLEVAMRRPEPPSPFPPEF